MVAKKSSVLVLGHFTFLILSTLRYTLRPDSTQFFFFGGGAGYHPTLTLSGIPTFTFIVSLTNRMDNI